MSRVSDFIEKVRSKPEHVRVRYVVFFVSLIMAFMIGIWMISMTHHFKGITSPQTKEAVTESIESWKEEIGDSPTLPQINMEDLEEESL